MKKLTITVAQAATALGIGRNSAYVAARTGDIPTIRVGKRVLVPLVALKEMLGARKRSYPARTAGKEPIIDKAYKLAPRRRSRKKFWS